MKRHFKLLVLSSLLLAGVNTNAQIKAKEINVQDQAWVSLNNTVRLSSKWGFLLDIHERRNNFLNDLSFHFIRCAANYWLSDKITIAAGYGHMWVAPTTPGWTHFANEHRLYQQIQVTGKFHGINILQRWRNEERWQQKMVMDKFSGDNKFTDRFRYLLSLTIPVTKQKGIPAFMVSDELCVQFGKEVVYNTFDQNRIFVGIKENISASLSFDLGYMYLVQEKASGYQYDHNRTFRWFFYYNPDFRKRRAVENTPNK